MEYKSLPFFATKVYVDQGIVEHIIAVMGVIDYGDDKVCSGAFTKTISERGSKIRVLDAHRTDSIMAALGKPLELREIGRDELPQKMLEEYPEATGGLWAKTQFLLDTPEGKGAFTRIKQGAVDEWSYGYDSLDVEYEEVVVDGEEKAIRLLKTIRLWEYGPVLWGMNPATTTLSAKNDTPSQSKPGVDVQENTIRIRMRDPDDFQEDSFRTISIGDEDNGIQAVIARLEGETTTTVQSYIFSRDKWTAAEATEWVDEHEKQGGTPELEPAGPFVCECLECGHVFASEEHCSDVECPECGGECRRFERPGPGKEVGRVGKEGKAVSGAASLPLASRDRAWDAAAAVQRMRRWADAEEAPNAKYRQGFFWYDAENSDNFTAYKLPFADVIDGELYAVPRAIFAVGGRLSGTDIPEGDKTTIRGKVSRYYASMRREFDDDSMYPSWEEEAGEKAGRILAQRNADRVASALAALIKVLEDAGIDVPGYGLEEESGKGAHGVGTLREERPVFAQAKLLNLEGYIDRIRRAFTAEHPSVYPSEGSDEVYHTWWVQIVWDEFIIVEECYEEVDHIWQIPYTVTEEDVVFAPHDQWVEGDMVFLPLGTIGQAVRRIGTESAPVTVEAQAALDTQHRKKAGPSGKTPTFEELGEEVKRQLLEIELLEVRDDLERETGEGGSAL